MSVIIGPMHWSTCAEYCQGAVRQLRADHEHSHYMNQALLTWSHTQCNRFFKMCYLTRVFSVAKFICLVIVGWVNEWVWSIVWKILTGENWNTGREIYPLSHYISQVPHGLAWDRTWASALKGWHSTAWHSVAGHGKFVRNNTAWCYLMNRGTVLQGRHIYIYVYSAASP